MSVKINFFYVTHMSKWSLNKFSNLFLMAAPLSRVFSGPVSQSITNWNENNNREIGEFIVWLHCTGDESFIDLFSSFVFVLQWKRYSGTGIRSYRLQMRYGDTFPGLSIILLLMCWQTWLIKNSITPIKMGWKCTVVPDSRNGKIVYDVT